MKVTGSDPLSRLRDMMDKLDETDRASRTQSGDRKDGERAEATPGSGDTVQFSERAQEIRRLRDAIDTSPDLRQELVERLRGEIASGQYRIDGTKIAGGILSEESM